MRSTIVTIGILVGLSMIFKQHVEGADSMNSNPPLPPHRRHPPAGSQENKSANNDDKSYIKLWKRKIKDGVNYEYSYHNPVKDGEIDQQGSVTLFKKKNPNGGRPKTTGYVISYRSSEGFSYNNPLDNNWDRPYYNNNNNNYRRPYNFRSSVDDNHVPFVHRYPPSHRHVSNTPPPYQHFQRPASVKTSPPPHATEPRCYGEKNFGYNSNVVYCCMYADRPQPSSSSYPKHVCWRQHITWSRPL